MANDFISFMDWKQPQLIRLLDKTDEMRDAFLSGRPPASLEGKAVALIWDAEGFRNRVAFELGIRKMGGVAVQVPGRLDERESIEDVARYLANWFDAIVVRATEHEHVERLAAAANVPVINARTPYNHPCEVLGDLAFVRRERGSLDGLRVVFAGEASNLGHSWFEAAARLPISVTQVCPEGYEVSVGIRDQLLRDSVGQFGITHDLNPVLPGADVIYTDRWPSVTGEKERERVQRLFGPHRITKASLELAARQVLFLPCPPVHRGEEVSDDAMDSPYCRVYEAKDDLLYAQMAVLMALIGQ